MTEGLWVCQECGHEVVVFIEMSLRNCPNCGAEHEVVGKIVGAHICHTLPIYRRVNESVEQACSNRIMCFMTGGGVVTFACYIKELYELLRKRFRGGKGVKVKRVKREGDPFCEQLEALSELEEMGIRTFWDALEQGWLFKLKKQWEKTKKKKRK